jgi:hypothetical protein
MENTQGFQMPLRRWTRSSFSPARKQAPPTKIKKAAAPHFPPRLYIVLIPDETVIILPADSSLFSSPYTTAAHAQKKSAQTNCP